jgi:hypothetical protein
MTELRLVNNSAPYIFKSLGIFTTLGKARYINSPDFPIGKQYKLTDGKFPFTNYDYEDINSGLYYTLNGNIQVKITGASFQCLETNINNSPDACIIKVEKVSSGGKSRKSTRHRRKSTRHRRKSTRHRRKSTRRL